VTFICCSPPILCMTFMPKLAFPAIGTYLRPARTGLSATPPPLSPVFGPVHFPIELDAGRSQFPCLPRTIGLARLSGAYPTRIVCN
jgi:hypothetical protein